MIGKTSAQKKLAAYQKAYQEKNKESISKKRALFYKKNKKKILERIKIFRDENPGKTIEYRNNYIKKHGEEKIREVAHQYYLDNKEKFLENRRKHKTKFKTRNKSVG